MIGASGLKIDALSIAFTQAITSRARARTAENQNSGALPMRPLVLPRVRLTILNPGFNNLRY
jgi:hypothetical protein